MGTTGLIAWLVSPAVFVLAVSVLSVAFYGRALSLGMKRSRCFLRKPTLIIGVWAAIGVADAIWLFVSSSEGNRPSCRSGSRAVLPNVDRRVAALYGLSA